MTIMKTIIQSGVLVAVGIVAPNLSADAGYPGWDQVAMPPHGQVPAEVERNQAYPPQWEPRNMHPSQVERYKAPPPRGGPWEPMRPLPGVHRGPQVPPNPYPPPGCSPYDPNCNPPR